MKHAFTYRIVGLVIVILCAIGCQQKKESKKFGPYSTHNVDFKISTCQKECRQDSGGVISKTTIGDTTFLRLGHWFNCSYTDAFLVQTIIGKNRALFSIDRPSETVVESDGKKVQVYSMMACNCYFYLDFKIAGKPVIPDSIFINSKPLENYKGERIP